MSCWDIAVPILSTFIHRQFYIILTGHVTVLNHANASRSAVFFFQFVVTIDSFITHQFFALSSFWQTNEDASMKAEPQCRKSCESAEAHFGFILHRKEKRKNREHDRTGTKTHQWHFTARSETVNVALFFKLNMQINIAVRTWCGWGILV